MTRILSELLQAEEPTFRLRLRQLEQLSGHQNTDIKLSVEVTQAVKHKIHQLGLDKHDTTAVELYQALQQRVTADDVRLERALRTHAASHISAEADLMDGILHALKPDADRVRTFAIKPAVLKRQLKQHAPKRVLKSLGYRSLDAMLRNEPALAILAAALTLESNAWHKSWHEGYKKLKPADFEDRPAIIISPRSDRWQPVIQKMITDQAHTVFSLPEMGAVVMLPLPAARPAGMVVASVGLALQDLNDIAAASNYLRASRVQGDFADRLRAVASHSVLLSAPVLEQAMPWSLVQQYFARVKAAVNEDVFGPYVQPADFHWQTIEKRLAELCASLEFWEDTAYLSFREAGKSVSLNIVDMAVSCCNAWAYEAHSLVHAQQALWQELVLRYVNHDSLEQSIASVLQPSLATEPAYNK